MYIKHFKLSEAPFSIAPNPRFLFMSGHHREALAHLLYGMDHDGGFVLLTGEVGTGKTTLSRCLLDQVPEHTNIAFIINPKLSVIELLATVCDELGIDYPSGTTSNKELVDRINHYLLDAHANGRKTVLIIDEAQNLSSEVLEQLRLLTNLETHETKLLQIILLGQPELQQMLASPELRQLSQRITARYHLAPLSIHEMHAYIEHRLAVAGCHDPIFTSAAMKKLFRLSQGIPRLINLICDRAMLGAYAQNTHRITPRLLSQAAREVMGKEPPHMTDNMWPKRLLWIMAIVLLVGGLSLADHSFQHEPSLVWPDGVSAEQSRPMAFRQLFRLWNVETSMTDVLRPCAFAAQQGLVCLRQQGGVGSLRTINRPAVIQLQDDNGTVFSAILSGISGNAASLVINSRPQTMALNQLQQHWFNDFTIIWRSPDGYTGPIRPGAKGPSTQWLMESLARLNDQKVRPSAPAVFDDALVMQLKQFQQRSGLPADGVAGPQTLIQLNTSLRVPGPRLIHSRG